MAFLYNFKEKQSFLNIFLFEVLVLTSLLDLGKYSCNVNNIILSNTPLDIKLK